MKKTKKTAADQKGEDLFVVIREHPLFQWAIEKRSWIPYVFLSLIIIFILIFRFSALQTSKAEVDFINADEAFVEIQRSLTGEIDDESRNIAIDNLQDLIVEYPELSSKYEGPLAQNLLTQGLLETAEKYIRKSSENLAKSEDMALYLQFSKISLLTSQNHYRQALDESLDFKEKLLKLSKEAKSDYANLFCYNLLRLAILQKQVGNPENELDALNELKKLSKDAESSNNLAFNALKEIIADDNFDLDTYIAIREKELISEVSK